jgi:hypothetical protein
MSVTLAVSVESAQASAEMSRQAWSGALALNRAIQKMEEASRMATGHNALCWWTPLYLSMGRHMIRIGQAARIALAFQMRALRQEGIEPPTMAVGGDFSALIPFFRQDWAGERPPDAFAVLDVNDVQAPEFLSRLAAWHMEFARWLGDFRAVMARAVGWEGYARLGLEGVVQESGNAVVSQATNMETRGRLLAQWAEEIRSLRRKVDAQMERARSLLPPRTARTGWFWPQPRPLRWQYGLFDTLNALLEQAQEEGWKALHQIITLESALEGVWTGAQGRAAVKEISGIRSRAGQEINNLADNFQIIAREIRQAFEDYIAFLYRVLTINSDPIPPMPGELSEEMEPGMAYAETGGAPIPV